MSVVPQPVQGRWKHRPLHPWLGDWGGVCRPGIAHVPPHFLPLPEGKGPEHGPQAPRALPTPCRSKAAVTRAACNTRRGCGGLRCELENSSHSSSSAGICPKADVRGQCGLPAAVSGLCTSGSHPDSPRAAYTHQAVGKKATAQGTGETKTKPQEGRPSCTSVQGGVLPVQREGWRGEGTMPWLPAEGAVLH